MGLNPLAFTVVTLVSFAALPAIAQDTDESADREEVAEVVDEVIGDAAATPTIGTDLPVTLPDAAASSGRLDTPEAVFIADALRDGEMRIAAAALARDRGGAVGLEELARRIEADQELINDRLEKLPQSDAATEPRGRPAHPEMSQLQALEGEAFDAAWLAVQGKYYRATIDKFERAGASPALDVDVRSAATEALTTLRSHADAIRDLADSLGFD